MEQINVSLQEVSNTASAIRSYNASISEVLNQIKKNMNDLSAYWRSEGSDTLINKFNQFSRKFVEESEVIESYAQFLDKTIATYDSLETVVVTNASNFN